LHTEQQAIRGGETHARQMLADFTDLRRNHTIAGYHTDRDVLALPATSRLSAHLHMGTLSPRACLQAAHEVGQRHPDAAEGVQSWVGELAWRDFYVQILAHFPHVLRGAFRQEYDALAWDNNPELFAAWCAGRTGYPIVDAAMRQLQQEAWMHNRARMIVASFLTKDLLIDWRWGERYFMQRLVDGDLAANNGGWQWAAGTGTDAQPYFRIFNPTSQGRKFDPQGAYVRQYVPELARVPERLIHEPWKMSAAQQEEAGLQIGRDYPRPIVDHKEMRQRALALYKAAKDNQ
jgi:deoxyribodipyrimidine photo-lyase